MDRRQRILIVEDSRVQAIHFQSILEAQGWEVVWAAGAEQAMAELGRNRPDLIILDNHLPGVRGDELCRRIRMNIDLRAVPVVMLTSDGTAAAELHGLESGADDFVAKSADAGILLRRIRALLSRPTERSGLSASSDPQFRRARILCIDDSPTYLEYLADQLGSEGFQVEKTLDGRAGLELLQRSDFDCIVVDLVMPELDGLRVCRRINELRSAMENPVTVLMLTGRENKEDLTRALDAGADDFVGKSSDMAVLRGRIRALLRRRFFQAENRRIMDELRRKEIERVRAEADRQAAEARAAAADERRAAAELRKRAEEERDRFFEVSHDLLCVADSAGRVRQINPAWGTILGLADAELLGRPFLDLVVADDRGRTEVELHGLSADGRTALFENRILASDGSHRWVSWNATALPEGGLVFAAGRDITERRRAEEDVRDARDAAEKANLAKSEFLSRMSHELRTPLNSILGFGQLLAGDVTSADQKESVQQILRGGRHLLGLINEVLDLAGIEAGRLRMSIEDVRLADAVSEVFTMVRPLAAAAGIRLKAPDACDWTVAADLQRLKQVLLNLLSNAIKYNRAGGTAGLACRGLGDGRLRIEVSDTGDGIPADKLQRLFTPFDRLGAEQTGIEGTGLGLAVSKRIVEVMNGEFGVESAVGSGSTFWLTLPLSGRPADAASVDVGSAAADRRGPAAESPAAKILYIEDNAANLRLMERIVARRPGLTLLSAMKGGAGLALARERHPDLILLDLHLPDLSGEEILRALRSDPRTGAIPVVVVSADATPQTVERLTQSGAAAYLTKPIDIIAVLKVLDSIPGPSPA